MSRKGRVSGPINRGVILEAAQVPLQNPSQAPLKSFLRCFSDPCRLEEKKKSSPPTPTLSPPPLASAPLLAACWYLPNFTISPPCLPACAFLNIALLHLLCLLVFLPPTPLISSLSLHFPFSLLVPSSQGYRTSLLLSLSPAELKPSLTEPPRAESPSSTLHRPLCSAGLPSFCRDTVLRYPPSIDKAKSPPTLDRL